MMEDWSTVPMIAALPNWRQSVATSLEFRTSIFEANTGDEQRRALRQRPRRSIEYQALIYDDKVREHVAMLAQRQDNRIIVPEVTRSLHLADEALAGDTTVVLVDEPKTVRVGDRVFLHSGIRGEVLTIAAIHVTEVTFTTPIENDYWSGKLSPGLRARLPEDMRVRFRTSTVGEVPVTLEVEPGSEADLATYYRRRPPEETFRGFDLMTLRPNWANQVEVEAGYPAEMLDYGNGLRFAAYTKLLNKRLMTYTALAKDREEVRRIEALFYRCKGRRGSFYVPSWISDMAMVGEPDLEDNTVTVSGAFRDQVNAYDLLHRAVCFVSGGTVVPAGVAKVESVDAGLKLTIDRDLASLGISSAWTLCWLLMARFASDTLSITWRTDSVAEVSVAVQAVRENFLELQIGGHRITIGGDYIVMSEQTDPLYDTEPTNDDELVGGFLVDDLPEE